MRTGHERRGDRRVLLVRHGESTWNASGLIQGQSPGPGLTLWGVHQARRCARSLAGASAAALYTSDLRRALQTAAPIGRALGLEPVADARLRERSFGELEGKGLSALPVGRSGIAGGRVADADAAPAGGESVRQLYRRASSFLADTLERHLGAGGHGGGDLVLVCHGGVVRVLAAWLDGVGPDEMAWCPLGNATVTVRTAGSTRSGAGHPPLTATTKEQPCTPPR